MNTTATIQISENKNETQVCKCCGKELPIEKFRMTKIGRMKTCTECVRQNQISAKLDKKLAKMKEAKIEEARNLRLQDFQPRELMVELKRRGYEFTMKYVEVHVIDSRTL